MKELYCPGALNNFSSKRILFKICLGFVYFAKAENFLLKVL